MKTTMLFTLLCNTLFSTAFAQSADPLYTKQWALENSGQVSLKYISDLERTQVKGIAGVDINWVETKDIKTDKKELIVAVLDSGVDITHPDLKGRIWYNESVCAGATNPGSLACNGYNFLQNSTLVTDDIGHGTHVAGIIAANRNNNIGVAGAADPRVKIMPLKVLNSEVNGFVYNNKVITDVIADSITFAVKNGAQVINLSLGWPKLIDLAKVKKAFEYAEENNVIVVAASGNNNKDLPTFPCAYESVICVGAIDNRGDLTEFTNHGSKVDMVAPGESIISTIPLAIESRGLRIKGYETKRGSSQAAPYVTAAVATLKLLHTTLTNDEVRDLLFRSSKKLSQEKNNRFVKFGSLDLKELLRLADETGKEGSKKTAFINPQIKTLTEVKFNTADRKFAFNLDLKNMSDVNYKGQVCLKALSGSVELENNCLQIDSIEGHKSKSIPVSGSILDMGSDSHILFQIQIDQKKYLTSLVFSRNIINDSEVITHKLSQASFEDMGAINGDKRISRMSRVFDKHKRVGFPEYFYLERLKQTESETKISLLTRENGSYGIKTITLPKVNKVVSIHRQDINMDGKLDYFIYTLSNKKDELQFYILDEKLNPLFKNYPFWSMTLTTFEGLPVDANQEKFEWLKVAHPVLGNITVPSIYRAYTLPEIDNSKIISERIIGAMSHQYYLNPVVSGQKMSIELRVIDSVKMMKAMQKEMGILGLTDTKTIVLLKPFPQTDEESRTGKIRSLLAIVEDGSSKIYQVNLSLNGNNYSDLKNLEAEKGVEQSLIYPIVNSKNGAITKESIFTSLLNRSTAEFLLKDEKEIGSIVKLQEGWDNPIIALIATFDENLEKTYLVESRSSLTLLRANEEKVALPIYRDSSFPGQNFSETLMPVLSNGRPGIFINSTLIYGERLYSMVDTKDKGFIRPLKLSISIPQGCVPLNPETLSDNTQANYVFLCTDANKDVSLKFLPMSHL
jgi:cell wall-associated protease